LQRVQNSETGSNSVVADLHAELDGQIAGSRFDLDHAAILCS
jgi:hypothetical protein